MGQQLKSLARSTSALTLNTHTIASENQNQQVLQTNLYDLLGVGGRRLHFRQRATTVRRGFRLSSKTLMTMEGEKESHGGHERNGGSGGFGRRFDGWSFLILPDALSAVEAG